MTRRKTRALLVFSGIEPALADTLMREQLADPTRPALQIRFDSGKVGSNTYGYECWKVFWRVIDVKQLRRALLFEGDTWATTHSSHEAVYCIALQSPDPHVYSEIRAALEQSAEFQQVAAMPMFAEIGIAGVQVLLEGAGEVDEEGNLVGVACNGRMALGEVRRERREATQVASQSPASLPERSRPASNRTASLPPISSWRKLQEFLVARFGGSDESLFWLTPEELCAIVERYAGMLRIHWRTGSSAYSEDVIVVTLLYKGRGRARTAISMFGLFPFPTAEEAEIFCYDPSVNPSSLFGQLEGLYGIRGRFATNFRGEAVRIYGKFNVEGEASAGVPDLWSCICRRREDLGLAPGSGEI